MSSNYDLPKIQSLLSEAFSVDELRCLCYDTPDLQPLYDRLDPRLDDRELVAWLVEQAGGAEDRIAALLALVQVHQPALYARRQSLQRPDRKKRRRRERNPFQYLLPVDPDRFAGRWPQVEQIAYDLTLDGGDSHAIIAGRRCGKSSLLQAIDHQLRQPATARDGDWLPFPLRFDFKAAALDQPGAFFAQILDAVRRRVDASVRRRPRDAWPTAVSLDEPWFDTLAAQPALTLRDFEDALGVILDELAMQGEPVRLVLLLDEIDETLGQPWTDDLFNQMRALIYSGDLRDMVRLVLAGSRRFLDEVSDRGSPLWNVLKLHYLTVFDQAGLQTLCGRFAGLPSAVGEAVWQQSGGHPFLAQYLLHHLWTAAQDSDRATDPNQVSQLAIRFRHERLPDLEGWARAVAEAGQRAYTVLAAAGDAWLREDQIVRAAQLPPSDVKRGLIALIYHGLIVHRGDWLHYKAAGTLFRSWFIPSDSEITPESDRDQNRRH